MSFRLRHHGRLCVSALAPSLVLAVVASAGCRPQPVETPLGLLHRVVVAADPIRDFERARLDAAHLDQLDALFLGRLDWTAPLRPGDEVRVLVGDDGVIAARIDAHALVVEGGRVGGRAFTARGAEVPAGMLHRPVASRSLSSYGLHPVEGAEAVDERKTFDPHDGAQYSVHADAVVLAAADGVVRAVASGRPEWGQDQSVIEVDHAGELSTHTYGPLKTTVTKGEKVKAGQPIATLGGRGVRRLHFEIREQDAPRDLTALRGRRAAGDDDTRRQLRERLRLLR